MIITIIMLSVLTIAGCQQTELFMPISIEDFIEGNDTQEVIKVRVTEVISTDVTVEDYYGQERVTEIIDFEAKILNNNITDDTIICRQVIDNTEGYMTEIVSEGDIVFVYPSIEKGRHWAAL